jgi:enoyl-CoA hydratase
MENILYKLENGIATITINRPHVLNALNAEALLELTRLLQQTEADRDVLCVVINASGEKAFCVGGDIKEEIHMDGYTSHEFSGIGQTLIRTILNLRMPVLIAAHGYALGAGMEMILASDFAFLSHDAKIAIPSINLGSMSGFCGTQLLPRVVGSMRAKEILMSGRHIGAEEAISLGLALKSVERGQLMNEVYTFAKQLTSKAPFALRCIKIAVNKAMETDLETGFLIESQLFSRVQASEDKKNGMTAFLDKCEPEPYVNR